MSAFDKRQPDGGHDLPDDHPWKGYPEIKLGFIADLIWHWSKCEEVMDKDRYARLIHALINFHRKSGFESPMNMKVVDASTAMKKITPPPAGPVDPDWEKKMKETLALKPLMATKAPEARTASLD